VSRVSPFISARELRLSPTPARSWYPGRSRISLPVRGLRFWSEALTVSKVYRTHGIYLPHNFAANHSR
jgi:hypothetical protein